MKCQAASTVLSPGMFKDIFPKDTRIYLFVDLLEGGGALKRKGLGPPGM